MKQNKTGQCYCYGPIVPKALTLFVPKGGHSTFCQEDSLSKSPTNLWDDDKTKTKKEHDVCKIENIDKRGFS